MELFLLLIMGICWTIVYLQLIYLGFKEKTYGMPFVALALNFAWEAIQTYIDLKTNFLNIGTWIVTVWFFLDFFVVCTYFAYGKKYFSKYTSKEYFMPWTIIIFIMAFALQYFFILEFKEMGEVYSAFLQNLIMSILFINMLTARTDIKGQNLTIAINKFLGSLAATILYGVIMSCKLVLVLGIFCSIFDVLYIYFLKSIKKSSKLAKSSIKKNQKSQTPN